MYFFYSKCVAITVTIAIVVILAVTVIYFMNNAEQGGMSTFEKINPFREKTTLEKAQDAVLDAKDELEYGIKKTLRHITD